MQDIKEFELELLDIIIDHVIDAYEPRFSEREGPFDDIIVSKPIDPGALNTSDEVDKYFNKSFNDLPLSYLG